MSNSLLPLRLRRNAAAGIAGAFAGVAAFAPVAVAQDYYYGGSIDDGPAGRKTEFVAVHAGGGLLSWTGGKSGNAFLYGANISGGGFLPVGGAFLQNVIVSADAGIFAGGKTDTLLNRTTAYNGDAGAIDPQAGEDAGLEQRQVVKRKNSFTLAPLLITAAYNFRLGHNNEFDFRIGPTIGATFVSVKTTLDGHRDFLDNGDVLGTTDREHWKKSGSKFILTYGATAGVNYNVNENLSLDLQYRFLANTTLDFGVQRDYGTPFSHQLTFGAVWRF